MWDQAVDRGVLPIRFVAPATTAERFPKILRNAHGFLYFVAIEGVTGSGLADEDTIEGRIAELKKHSSIPVAIGFGIKTRSDVARMARLGDAVIVGSVIVDASRDVDWLAADPSEPALTYLPSQLWLIGLGHLGQAYLWALGLLPFAAPADVMLVLQDVDAITASTESTSILTDATLIGVKKTRAMAAWAERRGFQTSIQERLFDADFRRRPDEPAVALCGLDNAAGRTALDQVSFDMIVEAGLGRGHRDFRTMRLHTLPGARPTAEMWKAAVAGEKVEDRPAYTNLMNDGVLDRCGMTLLAGKAVGAPFVGAVAATLALSEVLRLLHGGPVHRLIDLDLLGVEHRTTVPAGDAFTSLNPGYALAR